MKLLFPISSQPAGVKHWYISNLDYMICVEMKTRGDLSSLSRISD